MLAMFFHEAPLKVKYARGTSIFEENGKRNLDCINNVSCIGHCHPEFVKRMTNQLNVLLTNSRFLYPQLT
jgi:ethanolamine-phosphate phospho-lyase